RPSSPAVRATICDLEKPGGVLLKQGPELIPQHHALRHHVLGIAAAPLLPGVLDAQEAGVADLAPPPHDVAEVDGTRSLRTLQVTRGGLSRMEVADVRNQRMDTLRGDSGGDEVRIIEGKLQTGNRFDERQR